jgi:hypothetical protein
LVSHPTNETSAIHAIRTNADCERRFTLRIERPLFLI